MGWGDWHLAEAKHSTEFEAMRAIISDRRDQYLEQGHPGIKFHTDACLVTPKALLNMAHILFQESRPLGAYLQVDTVVNIS